MEEETGIPTVARQKPAHQRWNLKSCFQKRRSTQSIGLSVLGSTLLLIGCSSSNDSAPTPVESAPSVKIAQPLNRDVTEWDEFTGHIEAVNSVDIRARVSGYLEKVNFKAGDKIKKGQLLFLIDPKPYSAQLNFAKAELERAKSRRDLAKNDLARAEKLFSAKAISAEEHDARNKGYQETLGAVKSAEATVETARLNVDFTEIRSPIDGIVSEELITAGNLVGSDTTLLTTVVSINPVYVYLAADERTVLKYRRQAQQHKQSNDITGTPVQLALADEHEFPHQGKLDYIAPREDLATGTIALRAVFANSNGLLTPGFFARLRVQGSTPYPGILVPDGAIGTDQEQRFVWVVKQDNQVEYRKVVLGAHIDQFRVITQGLQASDWLITEGLQKIKPGIKVTPERISLVDTEQEK